MGTKGTKYLKITGILMIIFGGMSTAVFVVSLLGIGLMTGAANAEGSTLVSALGTMLPFFMVFGFIWSLVELITGVIGVKNCKNPAKAQLSFNLGVAIMICAVISTVWNIAINGFAISSLGSLAIGLLLPALHCYGAKLNQKG